MPESCSQYLQINERGMEFISKINIRRKGDLIKIPKTLESMTHVLSPPFPPPPLHLQHLQQDSSRCWNFFHGGFSLFNLLSSPSSGVSSIYLISISSFLLNLFSFSLSSPSFFMLSLLPFSLQSFSFPLLSFPLSLLFSSLLSLAFYLLSPIPFLLPSSLSSPSPSFITSPFSLSTLLCSPHLLLPSLPTSEQRRGGGVGCMFCPTPGGQRSKQHQEIAAFAYVVTFIIIFIKYFDFYCHQSMHFC